MSAGMLRMGSGVDQLKGVFNIFMCCLMYKLLMLLKTERDYRSKNLLPACTSGNSNTHVEKKAITYERIKMLFTF